MDRQPASNVTADHLKRNAYLYVRQSTVRQVFENTESTERQYALRQRARALGWAEEQIIVIDSDLGVSGAERDREGFQHLVTEVSLGRAGIVMGLEVSRLARNSTDWHRLLEICALSDALILDEDGIYHPGHFNDRLLLGLKGTMSEAELHVLRARLQGGILNKARRGELRIELPVGLIYDNADRVILDPDRQVQGALRQLFETFERTASASATVKAFRRQGLAFPRRVRSGPHRGELLWGELTHSRVLRTLHNPRYAGAFVFGRTRTRKDIEGRTRIRPVARDQWAVVIPEAHRGYIDWARYEANLRILHENAQARALARRAPPREGPALLQGLVICGRCGERMTIRYQSAAGQLQPLYQCQSRAIQTARPLCQSIAGAGIDAAFGHLLIDTVSPLNLEVALAVEQELKAQLEQADALRHQQVDRARYEAELAQRRYLRVDPDNRLVASTLEADWNAKLRALQSAQEHYQRQCEDDQRVLTEEQQRAIRALASDFPRLWSNPKTPNRERKRLVRLFIEDVTLHKADHITAHVRFKGGATQTLTLPCQQSAWKLRQTHATVVAQIDRLLENHIDADVATLLNAEGLRSGTGRTFNALIVAKVRRAYGLHDHYRRLRQRGMLTAEEIAGQLQISVATLQVWRRAGRLKAHRTTAKGDYLYEPPGDTPPTKYAWQRTQRQRKSPPTSHVSTA